MSHHIAGMVRLTGIRDSASIEPSAKNEVLRFEPVEPAKEARRIESDEIATRLVVQILRHAGLFPELVIATQDIISKSKVSQDRCWPDRESVLKTDRAVCNPILRGLIQIPLKNLASGRCLFLRIPQRIWLHPLNSRNATCTSHCAVDRVTSGPSVHSDGIRSLV